VADLETRFLYCLVAIDADLETYLVCDEDFNVSINDCTRLGDRAFVGASGAPPFGVVFLSVWTTIYRMIGYGSLNVKPAF
jgi:hypothetical protein